MNPTYRKHLLRILHNLDQSCLSANAITSDSVAGDEMPFASELREALGIQQRSVRAKLGNIFDGLECEVCGKQATHIEHDYNSVCNESWLAIDLDPESGGPWYFCDEHC